MILKSQQLPPIGTNGYVWINKALKECIVIDAPEGAFKWANQIAEEHDCTISGLILTHGHWDHILDGHYFAAKNIPTYGHRDDAVMFEAPERMKSYSMPGLELLPVKISHWVKGGDVLNLLGDQLEIRHVPGHCPGNILVYSAREQLALVGDVIFAGSIGRYDLPGGDFSVLEQSIKTQIYTLPDETRLYTGHGGSTTVGHEKQTNPYVKGVGS